MATLQHNKVYEETTTTIRPIRRRRRLRPEDPDFEPPDGGWGWLVCFASGFSNMCTFPMYQQFGLLFREKLETLQFSNTQITTIINMNSAFNSCSGLFNGPLFKLFTFRQVAITGASLVAVSLLLVRWCTTFALYLIFYVMCYGTGIGITQSSNALALNTYFKKKRRIATGLTWTVTGMGPVVWPYIITALKRIYGMEGTLMIFAAFAGHSIVCSLLLQPVHWHTKFKEKSSQDEKPLLQSIDEKESNSSSFNKIEKKRKRSIISAKYLRNEDDPINPGYEITEPGIPCMTRANDGWYSRSSSLLGSRTSLSSTKASKSNSNKTSGKNSLAVSRASYNNLADARSKRSSAVNLVELNKERRRKTSQTRPKIEESVAEDCPLEKAPQDLKEEEKKLLNQNSNYPNEKDVLKTAAKRLAVYKQHEEERLNEEEEEQKEQNKGVINGNVKVDENNAENEKIGFLKKIMIFFDLNLLKDPIYVVLMLGITIANFAEINFSILTPFVLKEFEFEETETATFMALLGATDIIMRFFVPFVADKIGWSNKTFFLVGVFAMAMGRVVLVQTQTFYWSLLVAVLIGAGKGLRTVFMALVIPGHVPLERLPAASGLQLASAGLLFLFFGPVIGWVKDVVKNYVITLHLLNIMTYTTVIAWTIEMWYSSRKKKNHIKDPESIEIKR